MFPCTNCGLCCQNISNINELKDFDLGNGTCKYFDNISSSCKIYETRPNICRIDKMYEIKYNHFFTKKDFYIENSKVCNKLQDKYKLDNSFKVIIGD
jgi:Fe-S-cluster containining protein